MICNFTICWEDLAGHSDVYYKQFIDIIVKFMFWIVTYCKIHNTKYLHLYVSPLSLSLFFNNTIYITD